MHRNLIVVSVAAAVFMANLDATIVYIALPTISGEYNLDTSQVSWVPLLYLVAMCASLLVFGRLSDLWGTKRVFLAGYVVFTAASAACGLAPDVAALEAARFVQGLGGAMLFASNSSIVVQYLPASIRGRVFGVVAVFGSVGVALGAPVGGLLISWLGWRWIFFINVPIGIAGVILGSLVLQGAAPRPAERIRFDLLGALFSFGSLVALVYALNAGAERGWTSPLILSSLVACVACLGLFLWQERRHLQPLLELSVLRDRVLSAGLVAILATTMVLNGFCFLFPFYFERLRGLATDSTGMLMATFPVMSALASPVAGLLADRVGPRAVCLAAAVLLMIAVAAFSVFDGAIGYPVIVGAFVVFGLGLAAFFTASSSLVMDRAPAGREGMTSALMALFTFLGAVLGVSAYETIYSLGMTAHHLAGTGLKVGAASITAGYQDAALFGGGLTVVVLVALLLARGSRAASDTAAAGDRGGGRESAPTSG